MSLRSRILRNHDEETVDEIVVHNCTFHLEQMDDTSYWIGIDVGHKNRLAIWLTIQGRSLSCTVQDAAWEWDEDRTHQ